MTKNIFITGISSGLGHGLAKNALKKGEVVYGISRRTPQDLTFQNLKFMNLDLEELETIPDRLSLLFDGLESLDFVILNAANLGEIGDLSDSNLEKLKKQMDINLWSNKVILDYLLNSPIRIKQVVAISSGASISGSRGWNGYSLSKAALNMLIKLYAGESAEVHFTSLAPGLVQTRMQEVISSYPDPDRYPNLERLRKARGTVEMPLPDEAAEKLWDSFPSLLTLPSGSYADIRKL